jgi:hypothetical protein
MFINDIGENTSSNLQLFADDSLIYRNIRSQADASDLQANLDFQVDWSKHWQMSFNIKKCTLLQVTRERQVILSNYNILGTELAQM